MIAGRGVRDFEGDRQQAVGRERHPVDEIRGSLDDALHSRIAGNPKTELVVFAEARRGQGRRDGRVHRDAEALGCAEDRPGGGDGQPGRIFRAAFLCAIIGEAVGGGVGRTKPQG